MPLDRIGKSQHLGFGGANGKDTTVAILIYEASAGSRSYSFDDTLRLYGSFSPAQLTLQLDQQTGQYVLRENWGSVVKVEAGKKVFFNSKPPQQWANQGMNEPTRACRDFSPYR
jgi:hypothetical protein